MQGCDTLSFGAFQLDKDARKLFRDGQPVRLTPHEFDILLVLASEPGSIVSTDRLTKAVWPDVTVTSGNLTRHVSNLNQKLGEDIDGEYFVRSVANQGYRLYVCPPLSPTSLLLPEPQISAAVVQSVESTPSGLFSHRRLSFWNMVWLLFAILVVISPFAYNKVFSPDADRPVFVALTHDGVQKNGPIVSDGDRVYFSEKIGDRWSTVSVGVRGGDPVPFEPGLRRMSVLDVAPDRSSMLLDVSGDTGVDLWLRRSPGGSLERLVPRCSGGAAYSPNGASVAVVCGATIQIRPVDNAGQTWSVAVPGLVNSLAWRPDGSAVLFATQSLANAQDELWQLDVRSRQVHSLEFLMHQFGLFGDISLDGWLGSNLALEVNRNHQREVLLVPENPGFWPGNWRSPRVVATPSEPAFPSAARNRDAIFMFQTVRHGELVQFDPHLKVWMAASFPADGAELSYSRDAKRVALVRTSDNTLWTSRSDGTDVLELTRPGIEVHQPHWSPDGTRIAFMGFGPSQTARIYVISISGGQPEEVLPSGEQGVPTWSPDGKELLYGELRRGQAISAMRLHLLSLDSREFAALPGSEGLWSPRWSPDGNYILATTGDFHRLLLRRVNGAPLTKTNESWREIAQMYNIEDAEWAPDSTCLYFRGNAGGPQRAFYRFSLKTGRVDRLADLSDIQPLNVFWFGATPDGGVLAQRSAYAPELVEMTLKRSL